MKKKHIHFVGIKGVGMTPLAIITKEAGFIVTGCDIDAQFITDSSLKRAKIEVAKEFSLTHIDKVDMVITTGAHGGFDNKEVKAAKEKGIEVITQGEAVGRFMEGTLLHKQFEGISVTGSHGKTTTTAMIATMLKNLGADPSYIIGTGDIPTLSGPGHLGKGKYFVAEADEYATEPTYDKTPKILWQHPKIAVITNIELDHPDLYASVDAITKAFLQFANQLPQDGSLVLCGDDVQNQKLKKEYKGKVLTYGFHPHNDFVIKKVSISGAQTFFWVDTKDTSFGEFALSIIGEHNALNATAALIVALELGFDLESIKKGLKAFVGSKRRFEYIGKLASGALVFDDYAHHPTEIKETLKAIKQSYPKHTLICIFQPHTYSRTKALTQDFVNAFGSADKIILVDIYPSLREEPDSSISSKMLIDSMRLIHKDALYLSKPSDVVEYINNAEYPQNTIILTMGAGDIYQINQALAIQKDG